MRKSHRFDFENKAPKEIDAYLTKTYGVRLLDFAGIVAQVIEWTDVDRLLNRTSAVARIKDRLQRLKISIPRTITEYQNIIRGHEIKTLQNKGPWSLPPYIFNKFGVAKLFKHIDWMVGVLNDLEKSYPSKRGRSLDVKSIIISGWGYLIENKHRRIRWSDMGGLYDWFWQKLENHAYYQPLAPPASLYDLLKIKFFQHRSAYITRFKNRPRKEGILVLFAKSYAYDNSYPEFSMRQFIQIWESGTHRKERQKYSQILAGKMEPQNRHEEIEAHTYLVYKIFRSKGKSVPMIVFPDYSYYIPS